MAKPLSGVKVPGFKIANLAGRIGGGILNAQEGKRQEDEKQRKAALEQAMQELQERQVGLQAEGVRLEGERQRAEVPLLQARERREATAFDLQQSDRAKDEAARPSLEREINELGAMVGAQHLTPDRLPTMTVADLRQERQNLYDLWVAKEREKGETIRAGMYAKTEADRRASELRQQAALLLKEAGDTALKLMDTPLQIENKATGKIDTVLGSMLSPEEMRSQVERYMNAKVYTQYQDLLNQANAIQGLAPHDYLVDPVLTSLWAGWTKDEQDRAVAAGLSRVTQGLSDAATERQKLISAGAPRDLVNASILDVAPAPSPDMLGPGPNDPFHRALHPAPVAAPPPPPPVSQMAPGGLLERFARPQPGAPATSPNVQIPTGGDTALRTALQQIQSGMPRDSVLNRIGDPTLKQFVGDRLPK